MWEKFSLSASATIADYLEIIDDASCYGFEFKVENHELYWREVVR